MLETAASVGWKVKDAIVWFHGIGRQSLRNGSSGVASRTARPPPYLEWIRQKPRIEAVPQRRHEWLPCLGGIRSHLARTRAAHLEHEQANTLRQAHERDQAICGGLVVLTILLAWVT